MDADAIARSLTFLDAHQPDRARDLALHALAQNPLDGQAHMVLSRVALIAGDFSASESHLRSATGDPDASADAYAELARLIGLDGERASEAADAAATAVRLDPESWRHRDTYATALAHVGDAAGATRESDAALSLAPADPVDRAQVMSRVGLTLVQQPGNRARGLALVSEANALDPVDPQLRLHLISALTLRRRWASAVAAAGAALALDPRSPLPPLVARVAVFMITRRTLGWMAIVSFLAPMLVLAPFSAIGSLDDAIGEIAVRAMCVAALIVDAVITVLVLRPLLTRGGRRTLWTFSHRSAMTWFGGAAIATALVCYLIGVAWGPSSTAIPMLPVLLLPVAWWVHGWGVRALPTGDVQAAVVQQLR